MISEKENGKKYEKEHEKNKARIYLAIDLKSFYASVECVCRGLDPLTTNLVVADVSRTEKTICLAVSPSLKEYGIPGRARLFEVTQKVREINARRRADAPGGVLKGSSVYPEELRRDPNLALDFIRAVPRMALYMDYSTKIYEIYMKYAAPEDIHVYSIDEVLIDATDYLNTAGVSAHEYVRRMIRDVYEQTGITATAGIGTNLYLAKVAMDIVAKHVPPDEDGVRIAYLDEALYREKLWNHRPLVDFWRVGRGYAAKLEKRGIFTMGDIARCSVTDEELLYRLFGVNAELLIDHAWGWEPCTMQAIKAYRPENHSFSSGQVLTCPYEAPAARVVVREMADAAALDLVDKKMVTDQVVLTINYDTESLKRKDADYQGEITTDWYGRKVPKHAHGSILLDRPTNSSVRITEAVSQIFDRIADPGLLVRRINVCVNHVLPEAEAEVWEEQKGTYEQLDLFTDYQKREEEQAREKETLQKEHQLQEAMLSIRRKYGNNAIVKGMNLREGATGMQRNSQIGGHKA